MSEPKFLSVRQVERLHARSIKRFGGTSGIRDRGLFESAVIQPAQAYFFGVTDLFDLAAAYAFHIAQAQACFDGNKRTGIAAAFHFLELNGIPVDVDALSLYEAMIAVAEGRMNKEQLAQLLRSLFNS